MKRGGVGSNAPGVGSSTPGRHPNLSIRTQAKSRVQLPKEEASVTTEGPGQGRGAQPHSQLWEDLVLLQTLHHTSHPLRMPLVPVATYRAYI